MQLRTASLLKAWISYDGLQRVETYPVPRPALREALLNAITHKDYSSGTPIQIRVYEHQILMSNTGQLPETWTVEKLTSPHTSKPFNPDIANTFFRAGKIESWGHGIEKMLKACEDEGLPKPAYEDEGIGLTLKFLTHLPPQLNETPATAKSSGKSSGKIVFLMQEQATISIPEIAAKLGLTTRAIEKQIRQLKADGVIHRVGPAKGGHWKIIKS